MEAAPPQTTTTTTTSILPGAVTSEVVGHTVDHNQELNEYGGITTTKTTTTTTATSRQNAIQTTQTAVTSVAPAIQFTTIRDIYIPPETTREVSLGGETAHGMRGPYLTSEVRAFEVNAIIEKANDREVEVEASSVSSSESPLSSSAAGSASSSSLVSEILEIEVVKRSHKRHQCSHNHREATSASRAVSRDIAADGGLSSDLSYQRRCSEVEKEKARLLEHARADILEVERLDKKAEKYRQRKLAELKKREKVPEPKVIAREAKAPSPKARSPSPKPRSPSKARAPEQTGYYHYFPNLRTDKTNPFAVRGLVAGPEAGGVSLPTDGPKGTDVVITSLSPTHSRAVKGTGRQVSPPSTYYAPQVSAVVPPQAPYAAPVMLQAQTSYAAPAVSYPAPALQPQTSYTAPVAYPPPPVLQTQASYAAPVSYPAPAVAQPQASYAPSVVQPQVSYAAPQYAPAVVAPRGVAGYAASPPPPVAAAADDSRYRSRSISGVASSTPSTMYAMMKAQGKAGQPTCC